VKSSSIRVPYQNEKAHRLGWALEIFPLADCVRLRVSPSRRRMPFMGMYVMMVAGDEHEIRE
jgi:hypothetical protein